MKHTLFVFAAALTMLTTGCHTTGSKCSTCCGAVEVQKATSCCGAVKVQKTASCSGGKCPIDTGKKEKLA